MKYRWLLVLVVAIGAALLGMYFGKPADPIASTPPPGPTTARAGQTLLTLPLSTPEGQPVQLQKWAGKVLVVNFWATWCPPCREEMPEFSRVNEQLTANGVQFVGIGIDTPDNILGFQKSHPVSYPLLLGSYETLKLTAELGNTSAALPFTVIIGRDGGIAHTQMGKLDEAALKRLLGPLIARPAAAKQ